MPDKLSQEDMSALMNRMDDLAAEADRIARWLDEKNVQKWVHRDLRSIRGCADRIAAHLRQELSRPVSVTGEPDEPSRTLASGADTGVFPGWAR